MDLTIHAVECPEERAALCLAILHALPDWFGNEAAVLDYAQQCRNLPVFAAYDESKAVGFVALKQHNEYTSEVSVMGLFPEFHRKGIGRMLLATCEETCLTDGTRFLTVKTLADSQPDGGYAKTRAFYRAMGFVPLEIFPLHWDEANPCLLMAKHLN